MARLVAAFGLVYADIEHHYSRTLPRLLSAADPRAIERAGTSSPTLAPNVPERVGPTRGEPVPPPACFGAWIETPVMRRSELAKGVKGPAIVEEYDATLHKGDRLVCVMPARWPSSCLPPCWSRKLRPPSRHRAS